ncbi:MAG: hypothetical protein LBH55_01715 [Mycoplasmataceae bacterium]|jgi:hypothetical protein|nr:hypothetical protein [Mycoplasmataceae bacterium]
MRKQYKFLLPFLGIIATTTAIFGLSSCSQAPNNNSTVVFHNDYAIPLKSSIEKYLASNQSHLTLDEFDVENISDDYHLTPTGANKLLTTKNVANIFLATIEPYLNVEGDEWQEANVGQFIFSNDANYVELDITATKACHIIERTNIYDLFSQRLGIGAITGSASAANVIDATEIVFKFKNNGIKLFLDSQYIDYDFNFNILNGNDVLSLDYSVPVFLNERDFNYNPIVNTNKDLVCQNTLLHRKQTILKLANSYEYHIAFKSFFILSTSININ